VVTTFAWVAVTFLTRPEPDEVLETFYRKVRPASRGWKRIARAATNVPETRDLGQNLFSWILGCVMVYAALFATGEICFGRIGEGAGLFVLAIVCAGLLYRRIARMTSGAEVAAGE